MQGCFKVVMAEGGTGENLRKARTIVPNKQPVLNLLPPQWCPGQQLGCSQVRQWLPAHSACRPLCHASAAASPYLCSRQGWMAVKFPATKRGKGKKNQNKTTHRPTTNPTSLSSWGSKFQWREHMANLHMWRSGHSSRGEEEWSSSRKGPPRTPWPAARQPRLLKSNT